MVAGVRRVAFAALGLVSPTSASQILMSPEVLQAVGVQPVTTNLRATGQQLSQQPSLVPGASQIVNITSVPMPTDVPPAISQATEDLPTWTLGPVPDVQDIVSKGFLAPGNDTTDSLKHQSDVARMKREVMETYIDDLQKQADAAEKQLEKAKDTEATLWNQAKDVSGKRSDQEVATAVSTAKWSAMMEGLDEQLAEAQAKAEQEKADREAMERMAEQAENAKVAQAFAAAQAISQEDKEKAFKAGAEAQRAADQTMLNSMEKALKEVTYAANAGAAAEATLTDMAMKAGKAVGNVVNTYDKSSPVAQAVAQALADAALSAKDMQSQEDAVDIEGVHETKRMQVHIPTLTPPNRS